uniref:Uncharacterized protein n=1 Tax=Arundo donax TaxID=35708 RepID=A0A0A8ZGN7_ARUDO
MPQSDLFLGRESCLKLLVKAINYSNAQAQLFISKSPYIYSSIYIAPPYSYVINDKSDI